MSTPSSKSTVMSVSAYFVIERSIACRGKPSSSTSIGAVMRVSTSSGVMPGALTITLTCVGETSGNASIGSWRNAAKPATASNTVSISTRRRWLSANAISLSIGLLFVAGQERLERADAAPGELGAVIEVVGLDLHAAVGFADDRDRHGAHPLRRALEDEGLAVDPRDRRTRHGERDGPGPRDDARRKQLSRAQREAGIADARADEDGL